MKKLLVNKDGFGQAAEPVFLLSDAGGFSYGTFKDVIRGIP